MIIDRILNLDIILEMLNNVIKNSTIELNLNNEELLQMFKDKLNSEFEIEEGTDLAFYKYALKDKFAHKCREIAKYNYNDNKLTDIDEHEIMALENKGDLVRSSILLSLNKHLIFQKRLKKLECDVAINIVKELHNHIGNAYYYENNNTVLTKLFENALNLYLCNKEYSKVRNDDEVEIKIKSMKYLENLLQVQYDIKQAEIILTDDSEEIIHNKLETMIKEIGGMDFLRILFEKEICLKYNCLVDRYLIHRNKTSMYSENIRSRIPYNYLIQIGIKHLNKGIACLTSNSKERIYMEVIGVGRSYFDVLNLQSYSSYEDLFVDYKDLPSSISKNMLFEKMFILEQYNSNFILNILEYLYRPFFDESRPRAYSFNDYLNVAKYVLEKSSYCQIYNFNKIKQKLKMKQKILQAIFEDISNDIVNINSTYSNFLSKTNFREKPLIKLENDKYFLLDACFCGYAFCEVLYQILKKNINDLDVKQGHLVENMIYDLLNKKRIPYKYGSYEVGDKTQEGECDLVLENDKYIIFIEIKKRPLPKTFEEGDDIALYKSLGAGMLMAQKQSLRHRIYLEKNGLMNLNFESSNGRKGETVIELKGRRIVSISICLPEYLFLTNKTTSQKLLESLLLATYHARDTKREKELNILNRISNEISELVLTLNHGKERTISSIFYNSLFRSLQQFVVTLENSKDNEAFIDNLTESLYIIDGSLDYYAQLVSKLERDKCR